MTNPKSLPDAVERVDTAKLRKLLEKAKLPWRYEQHYRIWDADGGPGNHGLAKPHGSTFGEMDDIGNLIVAAVNALPALLSQLDKLETENGVIRDAYAIMRKQAESAQASNASLVGALRPFAGAAERVHEASSDARLIRDGHRLLVGHLRRARQAISTLESGEAATDNNLPTAADDFSLDKPYVPQAIHYEKADTLEYVQRDVPTFARPVQASLDVLLDLDTREPIGWRIYSWSRIGLAADNNRKGEET